MVRRNSGHFFCVICFRQLF